MQKKKDKKWKSGRPPRKLPRDNKTLDSHTLFAPLGIVIFVKQ